LGGVGLELEPVCVVWEVDGVDGIGKGYGGRGFCLDICSGVCLFVDVQVLGIRGSLSYSSV
jgi:hypothetical protein